MPPVSEVIAVVSQPFLDFPRRRRVSGDGQLREAFDLFRLEKQGALRSPATLDFYDLHLGKFFAWLELRCPEVGRFADLDADILRRFRAELAASPARYGRQLQPESLHASHRALRVFLRWAELEGHPVDPRMLRLPAPRVPKKEMTVFHAAQLRRLLEACNSPVEDLALRILVGSGVRMSELYSLALRGPDGLPDLMIDSLDRGYAELRVRWDAAKGGRARRVPVTPQLAAAIKRYTSKHRPASESPALLLNRSGRPFLKGGVEATMNRLEKRVGFRVHAHAFRHTFATVATQMGWNFERLRSAMGHADYSVLQRYVRLASDRDLGSLREWQEFIVPDPSLRR